MTSKKVDQFVHLHTHTHFSILDGHDTIDELVNEVSRLGQPAVAVTDHGSLSGLYDLYNAAKKAEITPIAGCEFYMTPSIGNRFSREPLYLGDGGRNDVSGRGAYTHITILAENNIGLKNLFQLSLKASSEGFYQKPRVDLELLEEHREGLIVTTGCPSGEVQTWLRLGHPDKALAFAARLQEIFGKENVFMELMEHGMAHDLERGVRSGLLEIAAKLDMPLVATNDLHYATLKDRESHEQMLAIQTRSVMSEPPDYEGGRRFAFEGGSYYVKSADEMASLFPDHPEALKNTLLIAERSSFEVEPDETLRPQLPGIPEGETEASWLRKEAYKGLAKRLPDKVNDPVYIDRLNMELEVLEMKGFSGYFLVVSDFVKWGKFVADPPVPTGYGRGCLSGDTNILTPDGFKKISDIKVGDIVFDELGNQVEVPNVFEYDCDEPLVEIKGYYGNQGNKMTADHKVLISRANKETSLTKLSSGIKYKPEINPTEWVRADEVELGDLVVMPKLKFGNLIQGFHFNPESTVTENTPLKFSVRSIARNLNVARSTVMKFIANNGEVKGLASQKIANYFVQENITIEQMKAQQTVTTVLEKKYVEANYDLGFVFGLFISDGWIRKDSKTVIGFAQNRGEDEGTIPTVIEKVFGISPHVTDHKTKNLRQFIYRHKGIYELFANLFKEYNYTAQSKYIPKELMNTSEEFRKGLLEGLWYGDGTHKGKSKYSTVSQPLAEGVYTLLLSLGLPASIMETHRIETRPEYNKAQRESWTEYSILTAHNFDTTKMTKAKGYDGNFTYYRVREINTVQPEGKVYDFTVPTTNSYVTDSYVVHNSAAGSLVAFVMDITDADPIRFDLLFERFINPERDSPPDIDMDFNDTDRERVVEYVKEKYGLEYVAHVATFGKIGAKTAIKDVVRILERPYAQGDALSKALPPAVFGKEIKLSEVYNPQADRYHEAGEFRELVEKEKLQDVIESALKLEGRTRSIGVHAAALVISSQPVVETIPMFMRQNDGAFITQWDYPTAEALGLLKVDFLGLRNLGVIANTIHHIKATRGQDVDLQEIIQGPMDDKATYQLLQRGDTLGVFQLDGCLAGDTLVSGRKIKDLYKNYIEGKGITSTYSIDLSTGERKRNGIVRFVESGIKMVYRLVSESGRMIEATADHKFMTDSGWKRLGDIDILVDRVLVDHTVKTLMYRECLDCGTKINSEQRNNSKRCYKCSAKFHSNPTKKASREAIAEARIKFYENGGEPWNKGLNKDINPILAEVSRKVRAKLNGRNLNKERLSESEYLDYISEMSERMSGKNNPMYSKTTRISKKGYREDLGHYVRSSWEADYARVLNFLEEPYKYEPDTFELTRVDGSTMTYTPDFYLVNEDRYVEIKGFMRDIDAEKIKLVQEQHGIKIDVIAQSEFAELELEYKDLVAWECPEIPKSTDWENIISITQIGNQMTYDITMEAPLNNFLANGFMVHNSGMRKLLKQLKPTEFEDISAVLSLYRPGPMGVDAHTDYALRKNGLQAVTPIHPEFKESLADILGPTYNLVVYQEQVQRIAQRIAGYSLAQADLLRRAMGKKKRYIIDAEFVPFSEGAKANGYSDEAIKALWDVLVPFADYAFNKCVSDRTKIRHVDGTAWTAREIYNAYLRGEEIYLQAMWSDGEIRPHKVEKVVSTGVKTIVRVKTADNRTIEVTPDHRLLTTRGYIKVEDMIVGKDELIVGDKIYSDKQRENAVNNIRKAHGKPVTEAQIVARRNTMLEWNHGGSVEREALNVRASERMREYQAGLSFEDRSNHQKHVNEITDRGERVASIMREKRSWLYDNDEEFRKQTIEHLAKVRREGYSSGSGFGKTCYASNGMLCDSLNEQRMAEFLIELGIDFEMHKPVGRGECDFYFEGLYWEMDGMDRHISYFERKYGDIPFIIVTPEDYRERISTILNLEHARNGDLIVAIDVIERKRATIDIEMADGGPKNYVTWKGIVSHNSHTVGYGLISYVTAYLKANYPAEFMSALLSSVADDTDKTALYLNECKHMGITVYPPAVSRSVEDYRPVSETEIYFGLKAIRGMGAATAEEIVKARGDKPFTSFSDFMHRMPDNLVNKRVLEGLAHGGGFDDFGIPRKSLIAAFPDMLKAIQKARKKANTGMMSLFDDDEDDMLIFNIMDIGEYSKLEKLKLERHALGLYVSDHPLNGLKIDSQSDATVYDLISESIPPAEGGWGRPQKFIKISGIVTSLSKKRTKAGASFAVGVIEDMTGGINFAMFSKVFEQYGSELVLDGVYQFTGQHRKREGEDEIQFIVDSLRPLDFGEHGHLNVKVRLTARQWVDGRDKFLKRLERHQVEEGSLIQMSVLDGKDIHDFTLDGVTVKRSPALIADIRELFGIDSIGRWRSIEQSEG